ncbi:MAG: Asp23/Gls24 family envelope stress response protein [Clostridia bacterium]|nr:Asp23/Gls24 family envelope stress response protein [Clostridia bacterium]MEE0411071.1 Asp23/Gls24 family envelope stress response protein [Clostridia bacterium]
MKVIAFVGPSGTGKSYRSLIIAKENNADGIIDDGLLISQGKVIAGTSAKKEDTRIASVKHALFIPPKYASEMQQALKKSNIKTLMILGTSEGMAEKIAKRLEVGPVEKFIHIEDVATEDEIAMANRMRLEDGKHVIPVPTFEIQKDFSGYFLHPLRRFQPNLDVEEKTAEADKSIVRPTFSYMGDFVISDEVIIQLAIHEAMKAEGIHKINNINVRKTTHGAHIDITATVKYGCHVPTVCRKAQYLIKNTIEELASVNVRRVHFLVRNLYTE